MKKFLSYQPFNPDLASLFLRLLFGGLFVYYGITKIEMYDQILPIFGDIIGIGSKLSFNLVIFAEFFCGFLVLIGFFTRIAVIPIFITMGVAYFIAHQKDPFSVKQIVLVYLCLCFVIFILGSGKFSVDGHLQKPKRVSRMA
jgi:putative oxidoreductase